MNLPWKSRSELTPRVIPEYQPLRRELDEMFERFLTPGSLFGGAEKMFPPVDLKEDEKEIVVTCDMPGVDPKAVDISLAGKALTIKGERKSEKVEDKANYYYAERSFGSFQRTFELPQSVDPENITAEQKDGVLSIRLRKLESAVTKKIPISTTRM